LRAVFERFPLKATVDEASERLGRRTGSYPETGFWALGTFSCPKHSRLALMIGFVLLRDTEFEDQKPPNVQISKAGICWLFQAPAHVNTV
jgi:hypothetical protein